LPKGGCRGASPASAVTGGYVFEDKRPSPSSTRLPARPDLPCARGGDGGVVSPSAAVGAAIRLNAHSFHFAFSVVQFLYRFQKGRDYFPKAMGQGTVPSPTVDS